MGEDMQRTAKLATLAALSLLAACASTEELRARAMNTPPPELCYLAVTADSHIREAANYAIHAKSVDCNQYAGMIAARIQHRQATAQQGLMLLQAARPRPVVTPPSATNCRTFNRGAYLQTVCD